MFCPNCGSPNPDNAVHCGSCGSQLGQSQAAPQPVPPGPAGGFQQNAPNMQHGANAIPVGTVPNHMGMAIGSLVVNLLGCCLPIFGIVAVVFASQVNGKLAIGDMAGAQSAANSAKTWSIIGFAVGGLFFVISLIANIASLALVESAGGY
jgi:hypothetical protein